MYINPPMTYSYWKQIGGCSLSHYAEHWVKKNIEFDPAKKYDLDKYTISQITAASPTAMREIIIFAAEHSIKIN